MIAITIGTGRYKTLAQQAAQAVHDHTGLETLILTEEHLASSGLPTAHFLKLRLFDHTDADAVLFFDADIVCLRAWNPQELADQDAVVAVADRAVFKDICLEWGIPIGEYFNTGLFMLNRNHHAEWLRETERFIRSHPPMDFWDQSPLNIVRHQLGIPVKLLDRRYNWLDVGNGPLSYKVPIFMAHKILADFRMVNSDYFAGAYTPPFDWTVEIDDGETQRIFGTLLKVRTGLIDSYIHLNQDGTLGPPESPINGKYWFVRRDRDRPILVITSETEILQEFCRTIDGVWRAAQQLEAISDRAIAATQEIVAARCHRLKVCGQKVRNIELLAGGRVGHGASQNELFWFIDDGTALSLVLGAERRETCRLKCDAHIGVWEGEQLIGGAKVKINSCY